MSTGTLRLKKLQHTNGTDIITFDSSGAMDLSTIRSSTGNSALTIADAGDVGIRTTSPSDNLELTPSADGKGITLKTTDNVRPYFNMDANRSGAGNNLAQINFKWNGTEVARIIGVAGADTTNKDDAHLTFATASAGSPDERMRLHNDGRVSIGNTTAQKQLYLYVNNSRTQYSDGWIARFHNDGNAVNLYGLEIFCGRDDGAYDNYAMRFVDGDGTEAGYISFNSGTVTYGTFTAHHPCRIPEEDNDSSSFLPAYPYGTLLETISLSYKQKNGADTERGIIYNVRKTQSANSRKVLGAYGNSMNTRENSEGNLHQVSVLGDGHILCNNAGGNISVGDGICSSSTEGIGQKATANPSMIIGIAQEDVTFSGSETKLVAVQYGLQQFIPWS